MNIKPLLELKDGELGLAEKLRGKKKAIRAMIDRIPEDVAQVGVCHILNREDAEMIRDRIEEKFPNASVERNTRQSGKSVKLLTKSFRALDGIPPCRYS